MDCNLPYKKLDFVDVNNRININGKTLNKIPKELYQNDKYILDKLNFYYNSLDKLDGENTNGLIDHIKKLETQILKIKENDNILAKSKFEFLQINDCLINVKDLFPCKKLLPCDIYGYFENTHLEYTEQYINTRNTCENCKDIDDCKNQQM